MAKLPKLSDLSASMPGMLGKFKSFLDNMGGPASAEETEKVLANETDPYKKNILEIELLIKQLNDIQIIQNKTLDRLKNRYLELKQKLISEISAAQASPAAATTETSAASAGSSEASTTATTTETESSTETEIAKTETQIPKSLGTETSSSAETAPAQESEVTKDQGKDQESSGSSLKN